MHSMAGHAVEATIIDVIVALFITVFILLSVYLLFGARIDETISLINKVSIDLENKEIKETVLSENKIQNYPEYGTKYGTIEIPKIDVNLPVYYGDSLDILKKGVGHSSRKLLPRRRWFYSLHGA